MTLTTGASFARCTQTPRSFQARRAHWYTAYSGAVVRLPANRTFATRGSYVYNPSQQR
jgi:hypothetical protein